MKTNKPCVLFSLKTELFGIDVKNVLRVINLEKMMSVPKAPAFILGAVSLEGGIIPVVDLAYKIGMGETSVSKKTKLMVLEIVKDGKPFLAGIAIDSVHNVVTVDASLLLSPNMKNMGIDTESVEGILRAEDQYYIILNAEKIFEHQLVALNP